MKPGKSTERMPEKVFVSEREIATAGLANEVKTGAASNFASLSGSFEIARPAVFVTTKIKFILRRGSLLLLREWRDLGLTEGRPRSM